MSFTIQPATRQGVKPLIAFYAESGCGKTMSALLLARGMAGPSGKIVMADSESGRGSLYADVIPGGFLTFDLQPPFSPARYIEAIDAIEATGADVGVIDSGSHEWEGISGVLDMAGENEERSKRPGLHNWKQPKLEHAKFIQRLLRTKIPFIICLRAKYKSRQGKDERGKTVILKDDHTSPIQSEEFIFEATAHGEIMPDHSLHLTKCSHPNLRGCFPEKGPITIAHGEAIARWANGGSVDQNSVAQANPPSIHSPERDAASQELWTLVKEKFRTPAKFAEFLKKEGLIGPDDFLTKLPLEKLQDLHRILKVQLEKDAAA